MFLKKIDKSIIIAAVCVFVSSLGFVALHSNQIEVGRTLLTSITTGFFGFAKNDKEFLPEALFLVWIIIGCYAVYFLGNEVAFNESVVILTSATAGYLGFTQQSK